MMRPMLLHATIHKVVLLHLFSNTKYVLLFILVLHFPQFATFAAKMCSILFGFTSIFDDVFICGME